MNETTNMRPVVKAIDPHISNMVAFQSSELSIIPYAINQPTDPQLQDGNFCSVFIFGVNKYLKDDVKTLLAHFTGLQLLLGNRN